jgi:hypothetical protein
MLRKLIPHICIILTLVSLTMFILTQYNPGINDSDFYSVIMYASCISALITSGVLLALNRRS